MQVELKEEELQELIKGAQEEMRYVSVAYVNTRTESLIAIAFYRRLDMSGSKEVGRIEGEKEETEGGGAEVSVEEEYNLDDYSTSESEGEGS